MYYVSHLSYGCPKGGSYYQLSEIQKKRLKIKFSLNCKPEGSQYMI